MAQFKPGFMKKYPISDLNLEYYDADNQTFLIMSADLDTSE